MTRALLLLALCSSVSGCGLTSCGASTRDRAAATSQPARAPTSDTHRSVAPDDPHLTHFGRVVVDDEGMRFAWTASGFGLRFFGKHLALDLKDLVREDDVRETDLLELEVDGQVRTLALREGAHTYTILDTSQPAEHVVSLRKRTEPQMGTVMLLRVELDAAALLRPRDPPRKTRLEILGDSITAGFGNECRAWNARNGAALENGLATYGVFAARELDADVDLVAWSGKGVYRNALVEEPDTLPDLWTYALPHERVHADLTRDVPEVVLVNLGTNDFFADLRALPSRRRFVEAYTRLLAEVRSARPTSTIVVVLGPMLVDDYPGVAPYRTHARHWLNEAIAARRGAGDTRLRFLEQYGPPPEEGFGCTYHPSVASHRRLGAELAAFLTTEVLATEAQTAQPNR